MDGNRAFVVEAELALSESVDPAAVGACVTVELCGHWEHEGPCRWPHNSAIDTRRDPARFRTIFVAASADAPDVKDRVESALRTGPGWRIISLRSRAVSSEEAELAGRLLSGPKRLG